MPASKSKMKKPSKPEQGDVWVSPEGVVFTEPKIDVDLIKKSRDNKYIVEGLSKQQRLIFKKPLKIEVIDKDKEDKVDEDESKFLMSMVSKDDVRLNDKIQRLWLDAMEFGCGPYNDVWDTIDNVYQMTKLNRLPPETFENGGASYALIYNRILQGIRWNAEKKETEYWQTQANGAIEQLTNVDLIVDPMANEIGGTPYIIPIIPFVNMLRFLWNKKMQEANIFGAGGLYFIKVKNPQGDDTDFAQKILNNESGDVRFQLRDNMELVAMTVSGTGVAIEGIQEAQSQVQTFFTSSNLIAHEGTLIGGSSQPEFDLFMAYLESTHRWLEAAVRKMLLPYLEGNGFAPNWDIRVTIPDLEYDKSNTLLSAVASAYTTKSISLVERRKVYEKIGIETKDLKPEEEKALLAEYEAANPAPVVSPFVQKVEALAKVVSATPLDPHAFVSKAEMGAAIAGIDGEGKQKRPFLHRPKESMGSPPSMSGRQQSKPHSHGGPGSGRYEKGSGKQDNVPSAQDVKSTEDLKKISDISLPPDNDKYEYFYHATRFPSDLEEIAKEGIDPAHGKYAYRIWGSKDEVRDYGSGFVIFRAPVGMMEEGVDLVERGLQYREWSTREKIPPEDIVRVVRAIPLSTNDHGDPISGFTENEDRLARYLLKTPIEERVNRTGVPEVYQKWFDIPAEKAKMHGGPGSGRYPLGSGANDHGRDFKEAHVKKGSFEVVIRRDIDKSTVDSMALVERTLAKVPIGELEKSAVKRIEVYDNPEDVMARFEELGIDTEGEIKPGAYDFDTNTMYVSIYNPDDGDNGEDSNRTLLHEIGHSILGSDEGMANSWAKSYSSLVESKLPMSSWEHGGPGSGRYEKGSTDNEQSSMEFSKIPFNMDSNTNSISTLEKRSQQIIRLLPPKEEWVNPRGREIAEMAAYAHGPGMSTDIAMGLDGTVEGLISHYNDSDGVNITYLASTGKVPHVGGNLLKKVIEANPNKDINLFADPGAVTYYQHIGMSQLSGDEEKGGVFQWKAKDAMAFADKGTEKIHRNIDAIFAHGGPGSGRYPAGSGNNETSSASIAPKVTEDEQRLLVEGLDSQEFAREVEGAKEFDECYEYGKKVSEDNKGVGYYQGSGYKEINYYLRHPEKFDDKQGIEIVEGYIKLTDEAFDSAPAIPEGTMLWRGVGERTGEAISKMAIGDICEDKGFQSYSLAPEVAERFGKTWFEEGWQDQPLSRDLVSHETVIRAVAGKNVKGVYGGLRGEYEMLVNRGTKWKVVGKEEISMKTKLMKKPTMFHIITVVPQ